MSSNPIKAVMAANHRTFLLAKAHPSPKPTKQSRRARFLK